MAEISSLKIRLASADKDRRDLDDRLRISQVHVPFNTGLVCGFIVFMVFKTSEFLL
jgi:hypothetical protein